jgi:hypothetical protein
VARVRPAVSATHTVFAPCAQPCALMATVNASAIGPLMSAEPYPCAQ